MAQFDDLDAAITKESAIIADLSTNVTAVLDELKAAQSAGTGMTNDQVASLVAKLGAADTTLQGLDDALKAAEPAPPATVNPTAEVVPNP